MKTDPQSPSRIGRPRSVAAESHAAILDAVYELLHEKSVRDLSMEAVAKRAGVGKPTLYKWWPSKAALIFAMFHERMVGKLEAPPAASAEEAIRAKVRHLIGEFNGLFGKVMAELIAEGQSDQAVLQELYDSHISLRRASTIGDIERGKDAGEFPEDTDPELLVDAIFGPMYYRLLLRLMPLTEAYGASLIDQVLRGLRANPGRPIV
ncbi:TetR/AcrR family transcriptional regulator [Asticcacaulis sp.]|uniref:TetR/AcrR family transcriptional regulator n=1 Tax=Asticcacaulis sp. TaxID=1872648 RepID=UPI002CC0D9B8|nr:TetR/AcrR family transcriptional regulator [Asticcacaulis sp.]HTM82214.1 TetR/AcrR family transcriptional regulator [Asticcacaulis sp.]